MEGLELKVEKKVDEESIENITSEKGDEKSPNITNLLIFSNNNTSKKNLTKRKFLLIITI